MDKLSAILFTLLFSVSSHAAIIEYGDYSHDTNTDLVVGDGLEWLQWDRTVGLSWNDAVAQLDTIEGGGWQIASNTQMASLFNNFSFGLTYGTDENTAQYNKTAVEIGSEAGSDLTFISMFGDTYKASGFSFNQGEGGIQIAQALYGLDLDGDGHVNIALVGDD